MPHVFFLITGVGQDSLKPLLSIATASTCEASEASRGTSCRLRSKRGEAERIQKQGRLPVSEAKPSAEDWKGESGEGHHPSSSSDPSV